jgi:cobalt-zinc-cadmium efflux system membrane fusion protein
VELIRYGTIRPDGLTLAFSLATDMTAPSSADHVPTGVKLWRGVWMVGGVLGIGAILYLVLFPPRIVASAKTSNPTESLEPKRAVLIRDDGTIQITPDTSFTARIEKVRLENRQITDPLLTVSGLAVARVLVGTADLSERWRFDTPELGATHANWLKSKSEVAFARSQLTKTKELVVAETAFLEDQLHNLEPGLATGSIPERTVRAARAALLKAQLQGQKDIFAAESASRVAENSQIALERELSQEGIEPAVFDRGVDHMVLVSANVPETRVSLVKEGQACRVRFYAYPEKVFDAHVESLGKTVTHELRTLRVLFDLSDPDELLIPGMFAEVELGTDERPSLVIPAAALLHVAQTDYVLVETAEGNWRPQEVRVGEFRRGTYEVLRGLQAGQAIISAGSILLKPKMIESLERLKSAGQ